MSEGPALAGKSGPDFLEQMREAVERELATGFYDRRPNASVPLGAARRSLRSALLPAGSRGARPTQLLVELKHVSPGYGSARLSPLPPEELSALCEREGVAALSVIPQPHAFEGSLEEVARVARASRLPVLFKDFVTHPRQIDGARAWGASAVLLIARFVPEGGRGPSLAELVRHAHRVGLEALLEIHGSEEVARARSSEADVLGVNARDLSTLEIDVDASLPVLRALHDEPRPVVGMSGVDGPSGVERYARAGADAVLVGTAFSRATDPAAFLRTLLPAPLRRRD